MIEIKYYQLKGILIKLDHKNLNKSGTWKIQLTIAINHILSKYIYLNILSIDNDEERVMRSKTDNIEIMMNDEADEVIKELFDSFKNRY